MRVGSPEPLGNLGLGNNRLAPGRHVIDSDMRRLVFGPRLGIALDQRHANHRRWIDSPNLEWLVPDVHRAVESAGGNEESRAGMNVCFDPFQQDAADALLVQHDLVNVVPMTRDAMTDADALPNDTQLGAMLWIYVQRPGELGR